MRAKKIYEIQKFEQGGNPYKSMNIGQDRVGADINYKHIQNMLLNISKDYQLDPHNIDYLGFINININDLDLRDQEIMRVYLNRWNENIFKDYMHKIGILLQSATPDGEEIIFNDLK